MFPRKANNPPLRPKQQHQKRHSFNGNDPVFAIRQDPNLQSLVKQTNKLLMQYGKDGGNTSDYQMPLQALDNDRWVKKIIRLYGNPHQATSAIIKIIDKNLKRLKDENTRMHLFPKKARINAPKLIPALIKPGIRDSDENMEKLGSLLATPAEDPRDPAILLHEDIGLVFGLIKIDEKNENKVDGPEGQKKQSRGRAAAAFSC